MKASDWRISIRRTMNESDHDANSKAIDSPPQFRDREVFRQRGAGGAPLRQARWRLREAAIRIWTSLAWLNIGQASSSPSA